MRKLGTAFPIIPTTIRVLVRLHQGKVLAQHSEREQGTIVALVKQWANVKAFEHPVENHPFWRCR